MTTRAIALITTVAAMGFGEPAFAQIVGGSSPSDGPAAPSSEPPRASETTTSPATATNSGSAATQLINYRGVSYSLGWRVWAMVVPQPIVNLFVRNLAGPNGAINPNAWGGGLNVATGPEFVYRNDNLEVVLGIMYVGYRAQPGFFHGINETPDAAEMITANLFGMYLTSHFLWGIRVHRMFEVQVGVGVGVGYIGGELLRSQAYPGGTGGAWLDCREAGGDGSGGYCGTDNNHYSHSSGPRGAGEVISPNRYVEPNWTGGGYTPVVIPWISLPQIGLHFRPHRNVDMRFDGGYGLIGFYGGFAAHYVF